jgi:tetratricopeptide (TPR) repeat protein
MATIGAPFVLLISSSMLKPAARKLFEGFYDSLAQGYGIGVALDNARLALLENTERREIHRFKERLTIHVHDWFTPVLYQPGADAALLTQPQNAQPVPRQEIITGSNLTTISEAGFFGRWRELWQIEHWFVRGVRCVSINSFGGEGKTYLAREVGRWLHRTGFFKRVVFVDYANFQGTDAVSAVVSMIAAVSHKNLLDSEAATDALRRVPTLLILDNLETLEKNSPHSLPNLKIPPLEDWGAALQTSTTNGSSLKQLLDMAQKWSETGQSRVLFTTRQPSLPHAAFPSQGGLRYCQLSLPRLDENEALRYFDALMNLPPEPAYGMPPREAVEQMFKRIDYHPFSINLLARQLKYDSVKNLDVRLERALRGLPANMPQAEKSLVVSLNLVLETLEPMVLQLISKLGVFQGGAFENALQAITEISEAQWQQLRQILEATALIQPEYLNGVAAPYLKFHPSLAPILWGRLSTAEQQALIERHRLGYYELSNFLYAEEKDNPTQTGAIERKELPNLLCAVRGAVKTNKQWAAPFADNVKSFLVDFGLKSDIEQLTTETAAVTTPPLVTPPQPELATLSEQGKEFYNAKRYQDAQAVFERILERLGNIASYEHAIALGWLGRCLAELNQLNLAADYFQQALSELRLLESSPIIRQEIGWLQIYLATVLKEIEDYAGAKEAYEVALPIMQETRNTHNEAVIQSQLGTLAMLQGNLIEAEQRLSLALPLFQQLKKPLSEADAWHSLGEIHQQVKNLQAAAQAYQQAAQIREQQGELAAAAKSWYQFAQVNQTLGNLSQAETGYGKAIEFAKTNKDWIGIANGLYSLADLLHNQPLRLDEARQFAETGLSVSKTLDPNVATIWKTYSLLAKIAELQNDALQAHNYRCLARETKANSAQAQNELQQHQQFIDAVVAAVAKPALQSQLESMLQKREAKGWTQLTAAIRRVLAGDRDWNMLCDAERLDLLDSVILQKILQRVSNQ